MLLGLGDTMTAAAANNAANPFNPANVLTGTATMVASTGDAFWNWLNNQVTGVMGPYEGSLGEAAVNVVYPTPAPPTIVPGTGTPQVPSNYNSPTGTCTGSACNTNTQASPIQYDTAPATCPDYCALPGSSTLFDCTSCTPGNSTSGATTLILIAAVIGAVWLIGRKF